MRLIAALTRSLLLHHGSARTHRLLKLLANLRSLLKLLNRFVMLREHVLDRLGVLLLQLSHLLIHLIVLLGLVDDLLDQLLALLKLVADVLVLVHGFVASCDCFVDRNPEFIVRLRLCFYPWMDWE